MSRNLDALLRSEGQMVDVTLSAGRRCFGAHRLLLSACSPYFRSLFSGLSPGQHPVLFLLQDNGDKDDDGGGEEEVLESLLDFVYNGQVSVPESRLESFLRAARAMQIVGLTEPAAAAETVTTADGSRSSNRKRRKQGNKSMGKRVKRDNCEEEAEAAAEGEEVVLEQSLAEGEDDGEDVADPAAVSAWSPPLQLDLGGGGGQACSVCGKAFQSRNALIDHGKVHFGQTRCELCGKVFSTQGNLRRHRDKVHGPNPEQNQQN